MNQREHKFVFPLKDVFVYEVKMWRCIKNYWVKCELSANQRDEWMNDGQTRSFFRLFCEFWKFKSRSNWSFWEHHSILKHNCSKMYFMTRGHNFLFIFWLLFICGSLEEKNQDSRELTHVCTFTATAALTHFMFLRFRWVFFGDKFFAKISIFLKVLIRQNYFNIKRGVIRFNSA